MSSDDIAVSVRGLGKSYSIAHQTGDTPNTLAETMLQWVRNPLKRTPRETFWALQDVSFDIPTGEVMGIVGRNGAGKSTLLKLLSQITEPTRGVIELTGRVGSLLEVGTGFHGELTGRENIFLNGAILGMNRAEIRRQFDAIVAFAGVEQFLDTPVKRYSSGMYVRLAFAVAAHLKSEILIVDEVLAVGDAEFQKKCLDKMADVASDGRTILFVSHNMAAIERLCTSALYLRRGKFVMSGGVEDVVHQYVSDAGQAGPDSDLLATSTNRSGNGEVVLRSFHLEAADGTRRQAVASGMDVDFVFSYDCPRGAPSVPVDVGISIQTEEQHMLFVFYASYTGKSLNDIPARGEFRCRVPRFPLAPGRYNVGSRVLVGGLEADWPRGGVGSILVEAGDFWNTGSAGFSAGAPLLLDANWSVDRPSAAVAL